MPDVSNITASVNASDLQWYDCRIESAGPGEDETIWVNMTDTGGAFKQVIIQRGCQLLPPSFDWFVVIEFKHLKKNVAPGIIRR